MHTAQKNTPETNIKVRAINHQDYWRYSLIGLVIPLVGFILGIVYLSKDRKVDKKLGEHLLAISILFGMIWATILGIFVFKPHDYFVPASDTNLAQIQSLADSNNALAEEARDTERQTDLKAVQGQLEAYYATNGHYPTSGAQASATTGLGSVSADNVTFIQANMKGLDKEALRDPNAAAGNYSMATTSTKNEYAYAATPAACDDSATDCTGYTLTAELESGTVAEYTSLN